MMERRVFASEEVYSYEGSLEEPVDLYDHEAQMRFRRNVVYVPHVLTPVLLLEYVPVYVNYQTYDPYLINRFEVAYVPFLRPVSYIQFVPYYSLQAPEIISSSAQYEEDIFSNSNPSPDLSDAFETETSEFGFLSEVSDSQDTVSPTEATLESTVNRERSAEQAHFDDLEYEDDVNSSTSDIDEISILSLSGPESFTPAPELITPETCKTSGSQGFIYNEVSNYDNELSTDSKRPETISTADDTGCDMEADLKKLSCFDAAKKVDLVNQIEQASLDNSKNEDISYNDSECDMALQYPEGISSAEDARRDKEADFSDSSCFDVTEKFQVKNPINEDRASFDNRKVKSDDDDSSYNDDEDDGPPITLEDILDSDQYWQIKREEYCEKRRNHELYRSALEGDIRPRKCLPEVGTLATIFEDLPFPVNEPYDGGQDSNVDEFFDLPPLQVKKSESSGSELVPKTKKFRNTRKLFLRLFKCFKPKTVESSKPP